MVYKKHYQRMLLGSAFLCLALLAGYYAIGIKTVPNVTVSEEVFTETSVSTTTVVTALPVLLEVPAINLKAAFTEPLGLLPSGEVAVPDVYTAVGWYKYSPVPGVMGPSVILGHVDSYEGPAIFWDLAKVQIGNEIAITRDDGVQVVFVVEAVETYAQDAFPTQSVYGNIDYAGLRLVTCAGTYNRTSQRYSHNTVVYAKLKD